MAKKRQQTAPYPHGSTFNHPAVQAAMKALFTTPAPQGAVGASMFLRPNGSALGDPKVRAALEALTNLGQPGAAGVGVTDREHKSSSSFDSSKVQALLQNMQTNPQQGGVGQTEFAHRSSSAFDNDKVQLALQQMQQAAQQAGQVGATHNVRPDGSALSDPKVVAALKQLSDLVTEQNRLRVYHVKTGVGVSDRVHPTGSAFESEKVQQALQGLQQMQTQGGVGVTDRAHSTGSAFESEKVQQALQGLQQMQTQGGVGVTDRAHSTGLLIEDDKIQAGIKALGEMQNQIRNPGVGLSEFKRPNSSHINEETAQQIDNVGKVNTQNTSIHMIMNALNGGEISPDMLGRIDQPRYQTGCEYLLNMVPLPQGGITKRPGMVNQGLAGNSGSTATKGRLFPFVFSSTESAIMEFYAQSASSVAGLRIWDQDGNPTDTGLHNQTGWAVTGAQLPHLRITQSADVVYVCHPSHRPGKISRTLDANNNIKWKYQTLSFVPSIAAPKNLVLESVGQLVNWDYDYGQFWFEYVVTAIDANTGEESLASKAEKIRHYRLTDNHGMKISWDKVDGASEYRVYKKDAGVYGFIANTEELFFEDYNFVPDTEDTPPKAKDPFIGSGNYPSVVFFHQQRLGFAATNNHPFTIWLSQAGNYESMARSTPPEDDDAIEVTLAAQQANRITWCQSDRNVLAVGTTGGEWVLKSSEDAALTPNDLSFQPQSSHGSEIVGTPVLRAGSNLLYIQRGGRVIREFNYSFNSDKYESGDLGILARHLLNTSKIVYWAWQAEPYGIIWGVQANGNMVGITYMKEHEVVAWHRHQTNGDVVDVATIPGSDGMTQVWLLVDRDGKRYVEKMAPFFRSSDATQAVHVDGVNKETFAARCRPTLPETQINNGNTFLHVRKVNAIKARVIYSSPFRVRFGSQKILPVPVRGGSFTATHTDWAVPIASGWSENDRLQLIFDGADPVTVLSLVTTVEVSDMAGGQ